MKKSITSTKSEKSLGKKISSYKRKLSEISPVDTKTDTKAIASTSVVSLECKEWDKECITIPVVTRPNSIIGFNLGNGLQQPEGYLPEDKVSNEEKLIIDSSLMQTSLKNKFHKSWIENIDFQADKIKLLNKPFKYCVVDDFVSNEATLNNVRLAFNDLNWNKRKMDLYEFFQSLDIKQIKNHHIKKVHDFFKKDVHQWISNIIDTKIVKISFTCSFYSYTDYLLLHDDLQRDRAIAFVLYITDPKQNSKEELWVPEMGGQLLLYDKDEDGKPGNCVQKITPKNNRFVFFKVTNDSFHQVEEIFSKDHCRFSINGWFHTKTENPYVAIKDDIQQIETVPRCTFQEAVVTNLQLQHWIVGDYLNKNIRQQIQQQMEEESEISLANYFIKEKFDDLYLALQNNDIVWKKVGPLNHNNFEVINPDQDLPIIVKEFLLLFRSKKLFKLFRDYTDLDLVDLDDIKTEKPTVRIELQRWTSGCYSLLSDHEEPHLDVIFYLGCEKPITGGETMYVANDMDVEQALVSVQPTDNTLDLIYRDTCKFTRYVSFSSQKKFFYALVCSYKE